MDDRPRSRPARPDRNSRRRIRARRRRAPPRRPPIKFSLDFKFEGPAAPFVVAIDKGYFKAEGLDVTIDTAGGSLEPINRVASGTYDMGFGDINSLIKFRDANPGTPIKAVFMVYNKPAFSIVGRKSRGVVGAEGSRRQEARRPAAGRRLCAMADLRPGERHRRLQGARSSASASRCASRCSHRGEVDAITGFSFSSYINLKDRGVPANDITVLLMADYGVNLYGNTIMVNPKFAAEKPEAVKGFLRAFTKGLHETVKNPATAVEFGAQAQRRRQEGGRARAPADRAEGQHPHPRGEEERLSAASNGPARQVDRADRAHLPVQERQAEGRATCSTPRSCPPRRGPQGRTDTGLIRSVRRAHARSG